MRLVRVPLLLASVSSCGSAAPGADVDASTPTVDAALAADGGMFCGDRPCNASACDEADKAERSEGCNYYAVNLDHGADTLGGARAACFAVLLVNASKEAAHLRISRGGQLFPPEDLVRTVSGSGSSLGYERYRPDAGVVPGAVAAVFLAGGAGEERCPDAAELGPLPAVDGALVGTGVGRAFHIQTDQPVVAYQIFPYGGGNMATTSATLLLPTSAWGKSYVLATPGLNAGWEPTQRPVAVIVARETETGVSVRPSVAVAGRGGIPSAPAGGLLQVTLGEGEYLQLSQLADWSGSAVTSDKPVSAFGGHTCLSFGQGGCDTAHQSLVPVSKLGHHYVAVAHAGRTDPMVGPVIESPDFRLVGMVDETEVVFEAGAYPVRLRDGSAVHRARLRRGEVLDVRGVAFSVTSQDNQHPFSLFATMGDGQPFEGEGDPEWVTVVPVTQWKDSYTFLTDPTFPDTSLVVVRRRGGAAISLACRGAISKFASVGPYEYAYVKVSQGNFEAVDGCANGRHEMNSAEPFGLTVWGWGSKGTGTTTKGDPRYSLYASYAFPAGMRLSKQNDVVPR